MSITSQIENRTPILTEMFFIFIVGLGFTYNITTYDITNHFYYVLPEQSHCDPSKINDTFCVDLWHRLNLPLGDQKDIPNKYWETLNQNVLGFGVLLSIARLGGSVVLSKALHIRWFSMNGLMKIWKVIVYGITVTIFPLFSYGDYLYYKLQNIPLPQDWSWLDGIGIYPQILKNTHEAHVSTNDVYLVMIIGTLLALAIWIPIIVEFKKNKGIVKQIA